MTIEFLSNELLNLGPATKENRDRVANIVLENIECFPMLLQLTFQANDKVSVKAAWILEWICTHYGIDYLSDYLEEFTSQLSKLKLDSAIRPCAKLCEQIAICSDMSTDNPIKSRLTSQQIERIVETGFDWLITPQKIAVRAYTMNTLFLFGKNIDWIHNELSHIIRTKIIHESKGCKARGKHVINAIEKHSQRL
ncbi:MAG: adenylosuccinate lyase [Flavobacteriaceae bacterium]|nr:adenylosuccinate lyase [Flavobacteriaceae bacterium]